MYYADLLPNAHWPIGLAQSRQPNLFQNLLQITNICFHIYAAVVIFYNTHYREAPCQIFKCSIQLDNQKLAGFDQF